jgi:hypothetical protein
VRTTYRESETDRIAGPEENIFFGLHNLQYWANVLRYLFMEDSYMISLGKHVKNFERQMQFKISYGEVGFEDTSLS